MRRRLEFEEIIQTLDKNAVHFTTPKRMWMDAWNHAIAVNGVSAQLTDEEQARENAHHAQHMHHHGQPPGGPPGDIAQIINPPPVGQDMAALAAARQHLEEVQAADDLAALQLAAAQAAHAQHQILIDDQLAQGIAGVVPGHSPNLVDHVMGSRPASVAESFQSRVSAQTVGDARMYYSPPQTLSPPLGPEPDGPPSTRQSTRPSSRASVEPQGEGEAHRPHVGAVDSRRKGKKKPHVSRQGGTIRTRLGGERV